MDPPLSSFSPSFLPKQPTQHTLIFFFSSGHNFAVSIPKLAGFDVFIYYFWYLQSHFCSTADSVPQVLLLAPKGPWCSHPGSHPNPSPHSTICRFIGFSHCYIIHSALSCAIAGSFPHPSSYPDLSQSFVLCLQPQQGPTGLVGREEVLHCFIHSVLINLLSLGFIRKVNYFKLYFIKT